MEERPKVGIGVFIVKDGEVLMAKRKNGHGKGNWGGTGGHLEHLESFADCAKRETTEEAGIEIDNIRFLCLTNFKDHAPKHYVDIGLLADWKSGEPQNLEPDVKEDWIWFDIKTEIPDPLWGVMANYFEAYRTGQQYFDA